MFTRWGIDVQQAKILSQLDSVNQAKQKGTKYLPLWKTLKEIVWVFFKNMFAKTKIKWPKNSSRRINILLDPFVVLGDNEKRSSHAGKTLKDKGFRKFPSKPFYEFYEPPEIPCQADEYGLKHSDVLL